MNGFLFVGLVGFLAGIFLAPKKGSELRSQLSEKMNDLKSSAKDKVNQVKEVVTPVISQVKEEGCTLKHEGQEIVHDVSACLDKNLDNGKQVLESAQERLSDKVAPVVTLIKDDAKGLEEKAHSAANKVSDKIGELKKKGTEAFSELKHKGEEKLS
jgi:gas vesicle protein